MPLKARPSAFRTVIAMLILRAFSSLKAVSGEFSCTYRLATKGDIPSITSCNVMSLPENYSREYYKRHFKLWPTLAVIAENDDRKLIGYALGRVEAVDGNDATPSGLCGHVASIAVLEDYRGQGISTVQKLSVSKFSQQQPQLLSFKPV